MGRESLEQIIGFALFMFALGMLLMFVIDNSFLAIVIITGCLFAGYYLFSCGGK